MGTDTIPDDREARKNAEFIEKCVRPPSGANTSILTGRIMYIRSDDANEGFWPLFPAKVEE